MITWTPGDDQIERVESNGDNDPTHTLTMPLALKYAGMAVLLHVEKITYSLGAQLPMLLGGSLLVRESDCKVRE